MADILIVDDEKDIRELVAGILEDEGHTARTAESSATALSSVSARRPELIFLDVWLKGSELDGLQLLEAILELQPNVPVVMISGHGTVETAVEAIKKGAYDFIEKPFNADRLVLIVERALEAVQLKRENIELKAQSHPVRELVGSSLAVSKLKANIEKLSQTQSRVFLFGAPGTGKDLLARILHERSQRHAGPFVNVNCASLSAEHFERDMFGQEGQTQKGRVLGFLEQAHGGTLYLDDVSSLTPEAQSKLVRVLVDQHFVRLGGGTRVHVDVRIVSSSSVDMTGMIQDGRFREDLYHRLAVVPLVLPPLNERREDIPELMQALMEQISRTSGLAPCKIGSDALVMLQTHSWQGNVRELRNVVERLMIMADGAQDVPITADKLPQEIFSSLPPLPVGSGAEQIMSLPLREAREIFEREYLLAQINRFGGNVSRTAEFVGMERSALHRKLKSLGVG